PQPRSTSSMPGTGTGHIRPPKRWGDRAGGIKGCEGEAGSKEPRSDPSRRGRGRAGSARGSAIGRRKKKTTRDASSCRAVTGQVLQELRCPPSVVGTTEQNVDTSPHRRVETAGSLRAQRFASLPGG